MTKKELQKAIDKADKVLGEGFGPLDVRCPCCGSGAKRAGEWGGLCYNPDGKLNAGSHIARVEAAELEAARILEAGEAARQELAYRENAQLSIMPEIEAANQTVLF